MMHYVYVLQRAEGGDEFYIGATSDLRRRMDEHNRPHRGFTGRRRWRLIYYEAYTTAQAAFDRERRLKHDGRVRRFLMERLRRHLE